jgi:hypothetical protein
VGDALKRIASEEGFGALYKGLAPNIGRGMTMNMGMMACSDQAKELMLTLTGVRKGEAACQETAVAWNPRARPDAPPLDSSHAS